MNFAIASCICPSCYLNAKEEGRRGHALLAIACDEQDPTHWIGEVWVSSPHRLTHLRKIVEYAQR